VPPLHELDDVLHEDVVARRREGRDAAVEPVEEARPHLVDPRERTGLVPSRGHDAGRDQRIGPEQEIRACDRRVPHRRVVCRSYGPTAAAGGPRGQGRSVQQ